MILLSSEMRDRSSSCSMMPHWHLLDAGGGAGGSPWHSSSRQLMHSARQCCYNGTRFNIIKQNPMIRSEARSALSEALAFR